MNIIEPIRETISLCPICRRRIPAVLVEDGGSVFMEKECPEHGPFRLRIAKYAHYYKDLMRLYDRLHRNFPPRSGKIESCAFTTSLRCDMKCPICFTGDKERVTPSEITLSEIKEKLSPVRGKGIHVKLIGGEPTIRDDLPEIIRIVRDSGNYPVITTNGVKIEDYDYLKSLKDSGLWGVAPWFDSLDKEEVFERMRGRKMLLQRQKMLENIERLGLKFIAFFTCVKGVNDRELHNILKLPDKYPNLFRVAVEGYMHRGNKGFSESNAYTPDELWEVIVDSTEVFASLDELLVMLKVNLLSQALRGVYRCYNTQFVLMPRSNRREDSFDPVYWNKVLERFESLLSVNPGRARSFFLRKFGIELLKRGFVKPLVRRFILREEGLPEVFIPSRYYWLAFQVLYYPPNYDEEMVRKFCPYPSLNPGLEKKISFCEYYNLYLKT